MFLSGRCSSQLFQLLDDLEEPMQAFLQLICLSDFSKGTCKVLMLLTQMSSRVNNLLDRWFVRTTVRLKERKNKKRLRNEARNKPPIAM